MRPKIVYRAGVFTLLSLLAISLSGCANNIQIPAVEKKGAAELIISKPNFAKILESAQSDLAAGDKDFDINALGVRIQGPARVQRGAQYALKKIFGDKYQLPALVIDAKAEPISAGTDFPRVAASVNQPNEQQNFQTLSVWLQNDPRGMYVLWGQTYLFPDLKIPKLKSKLSDIKTIAAAEKYGIDPSVVLPAYTEYLNSGEQATIKFNNDDPIFTQVKEQRTQLTGALGELADVQTPAAPAEQGYQLIPTEDGGAILVGAIQYNVVVTRSKDDATLRLKGEIGALASGNAAEPQVDVKKKLTAAYSLLTAFYIPPKVATDTTVQVIGATAPALLSVTNEE